MSAKHLTPEQLNKRRVQAVRLRLDGHTIANTAASTGLSAPTVSAAWKAFREGGWEAVPVRPRGRKAGQAESLDAAAQQALSTCLTEQPPADAPAWSSGDLVEALQQQGHKVSPRAIDHWLEARDLKPAPLVLAALERKRDQGGRWYRQQVAPVLAEVRKVHGAFWQGGVHVSRPSSGPGRVEEQRRYQLYLHGKRGVLYSRVLTAPPMADDYLVLFERLLKQADDKPLALVFHGAYFQASPEVGRWLEQHPQMRLMMVPPGLRKL